MKSASGPPGLLPRLLAQPAHVIGRTDPFRENVNRLGEILPGAVDLRDDRVRIMPVHRSVHDPVHFYSAVRIGHR